MSERERRIGRNEALFREVNERLRNLNTGLSGLTGVMEIVCECGDIQCAEQLTIPAARYEDVRSDATWFVIVPGHEVTDVELVVASHPGYDIVQKRSGDAALVVEATDPRE